MKPFQTIQLNVKVPEQTADEIKRLAISRHQTVAELLRHFIEEGLKIHSYEQSIDFIAGIVRQEFTSATTLRTFARRSIRHSRSICRKSTEFAKKWKGIGRRILPADQGADGNGRP